MMLPSPIMMICAGNMCRSPFAEHYMRMRLQLLGVEAECFSRGLLAMPGRKVPAVAQKVGLEFGVDMSHHISQTMSAPDVDREAVIKVLESEQRKHVRKVRPVVLGKVVELY